MLTLTGLLPALAGLLVRLGLEPSLAAPLAGGFFEMSGGVMALAGPANPARLAAAAFLLAWGGLSVHCQTLSLLADSDLSAGPYLAGKLTQGLLAGRAGRRSDSDRFQADPPCRPGRSGRAGSI